MCNPTAAMLALTAVSTAYTIHSQNQNAKRSEEFFNRSQAEEAKQIHSSKSIAAQNRAHRARAERARLRAVSAESGLTGISTEELLDNVDFQAGRDIARINLSEDFAQTTSRFQLESNLNNIEQPDYIGGALNIAGSGLQLYNRPPATTTT